MTTLPTPERITRRQLMGAAALGSVWLATGCSGNNPRPAANPDLEILSRLVELERRVEAAYGELAHVLPSPLRQFGAHEAEHVLALEQAMRDLGARPPAASVPAPVEAHGEVAAVEHMIELEGAALAGYLSAIERVRSGDLRATLAAALTVDAEHTTVLQQAAGRPGVPDAILGGQR